MNACLGFCLASIVSLALAKTAKTAEQPLKLTGIVVGPKEKYALLEKQRIRGSPDMPILRQGESWEAYEILMIDEKAGAVKLRERKTDQELELKLVTMPREPTCGRSLRFIRCGAAAR